MPPAPQTAGDWQLIMPKGEFPIVDDAGRKRVQVFDDAALLAVEEKFKPKILIDRDHFSYDADKTSEAYGWVVDVESRADGLWGQIEWTDLGQSAVSTQRFRFLSPAFRPEDLQILDGSRVRPLRLDTAALTNLPNIATMPPLLLNRANGRGEKFGSSSKARPVLNANRGIPAVLRNRGSYISGADFINEIRKTRGGTFEEAWEATRPMLNRFAERGHALLNNLWQEAAANEQSAFDQTWDIYERSETEDRGNRFYRSGVQPKEQFRAAVQKLMNERGLSFEAAWNQLKESEPLFWLRHVFTVTSNGQVG